MIGAGMLLLAALIHPAGEPATPEPPSAIIDFLGRRAECLQLRDMWGGTVPPPGHENDEEWRRYACDRIAEEEAVLRRRHADDPTYVNALDRDPRRFHLRMLIITSYEGGGPVIETMELTGSDPERQRRVRVAFDTQAAGGRRTRVSAYVDGRRFGEVMLDNRRFEHIDLRTAIVDFGRGEGLVGVSLRYGYPRPWCFENDDARPQIDIAFEGDSAASASRREFVNCGGEYKDIPTGHLRAVPQ